MAHEEASRLAPIQVTARFDKDGHITPIDFTWQGKLYLITSIGRRWESKEGLHILVMAPGDRVFELVFSHSSGRWYLGKNDRLPGVA